MKNEEIFMADENKIRKGIWERKDAVDAKMAEPGFEALTGVEQDACVLGLMLGLPMELAARCVRGEAEAGEMAQLWEEIEEVFKYGMLSGIELNRHRNTSNPHIFLVH